MPETTGARSDRGLEPHSCGTSRRFLVVLTAACLILAGCSSPIRYYSCDEPPKPPAVEARAVWKCNLDVMQRVTKGGQFSLREFWGAAEFFEDLTGIAADVRQSRQGEIPGPDIADSLRSWKDWYLQHGEQLVWDSATGSVRLRSAGES
jgi:hypothetical protein